MDVRPKNGGDVLTAERPQSLRLSVGRRTVRDVRVTDLQAVAWAPFTYDDLDWVRRRDTIAVAWAMTRARSEGAKTVLRVPTNADHWKREAGALGAFAKASTVVTNRGKSHGWGVTLVPWGYAREVGDGMACARGSSLVVTEHPALLLEGWAMALGAIDLRTGEVTADTRTDEQRADLDHLVDSLYNGWRGVIGVRAAQRVLPKLAESGMTWAVFVGSILALDPSRVEVKEMKRYAPQVWQDEAAAWSAMIARLD